MMVVIIIASILSVCCAVKSQRYIVLQSETARASTQIYRFNDYWFFASYFILSIVCALSMSGTDLAVYASYYESWTFNDLFDYSFEIGDRVLFLFLHLIIPNPYWGLAIIKFITISIMFYSFYLDRHRINLGLAVFYYVSLLFVFNFHLLRIMLAVSLVSLGIVYELIGNRKKCIVLLILAFFFHYSSVIMLFVFLIYISLGNRLSIFKLSLISILLTLVYANIPLIIKSIIDGIDVFHKYRSYILTQANSGSGIVQIVLFLLIALILYFEYKNNKDNDFFNLFFLLGIMTFFCGSMGYVYSVLSRTVYYFYCFFFHFCSSLPYSKQSIYFKSTFGRANITTIISIAYMFFYIIIYYIIGNGFETNGVDYYYLIN